MRSAIIVFILMLVAGFSDASPISKYLDAHQESVRATAERVGNANCVEDMCFGKTLQAITWQESSFGKNTIGDAKGTSYFYKHMGEEVYISKSETYVSNGVRYYNFKPVKKVYVKKVYSRVGWKPLAESSLGAFQIQIPTARRVIEKQKMTEYYHLLSNEQNLVNWLLHDVEFGAEIAVNYLIMNYTWAKGKYKSPWKLAVSRYNGGNNNTRYIGAILKKVRQL